LQGLRHIYPYTSKVIETCRIYIYIYSYTWIYRVVQVVQKIIHIFIQYSYIHTHMNISHGAGSMINMCMYMYKRYMRICTYVWCICTYTRVHEPYMGFARIFQKIPPLIRRRPNFMFQMQEFDSYKWPKKSICAKKILRKNSKRMRWTSLEYFLKTNRIQLTSFLNSKFSSTFHGVSRLFAKTKVRKN